MPFFIKIETKDQYNFIKRIVDNSHIKMHSNVGAYVEYIEIVDALKEAFENPVDLLMTATNEEFKQALAKETASPSKSETTDKSKKTKTSAKKNKTGRQRGPAVAKLPSLCPDHPTFKAMRTPRTDCYTCWVAYQKLNPTLYANARRKFERAQRAKNA